MSKRITVAWNFPFS